MYKLGENIINNCGNKAMFLSLLKAKGYNIPLGVVIDFEEFKNMVKNQNIDFDTIEKLQIPDELIDKIFELIPEEKMFAVRSSANIEDGDVYSSAGRYNTYLNVAHNREGLKDKIKECFLSAFSEDNLKYYKRKNIDINKVEMNVIVQEMIESNVSGILFTVNPTNGNDTEIVIEFSRGAGEVVNGNIIPERLVYDWKEEKYIEEPKINLLGETSIRRIINISLTLQQELGFPIDLEFGVYDSKLYIFQIRRITKVEYKNVYYRYNIGFDGFESLSPFILSLYKEIYTNAQIEFGRNFKNFTDNDILKPLMKLKFSRYYYNLTFLKNILENIPGYVERYIDETLKVRIDYLDNGKENLEEKNTKFNIFNKNTFLYKIKKKTINAEEYRNEKLIILNEISSIEDLKEKTEKLIEQYKEIKSAYIFQQLINLSYKINLNQRFGKILSRTEIESLLLAIDNKYKNSPYLHMWDTSRKIKNDKSQMKFFDENLDAEIYYLYRKDRDNEKIKSFLTDFIDLYGYHSFNEKDIISNTYEEEILRVIKMYRDILDMDDNYNMLFNLKEENKIYESVLEKLKENLKPAQYKANLKHIEYVRGLKRDEYALKDLELICRAKLRKSLLEVGASYKEKYIIENENDIFFLDYKDVLNRDKLEKMKSIVNKNKLYYNSFRNYEPQTDIFPCIKQQIQMDYRNNLKGIGVSFGKVSARACVIKSKDDLKNLKKSDVIVTKYIDSDMFNSINLSHISGIITETGGMLCHFAINARENRIPCVVGIENVTELIRTGENVVINGDNGEVII